MANVGIPFSVEYSLEMQIEVHIEDARKGKYGLINPGSL
ncbi:hypothetical protein AM1_0363 [Acaryochloris marina MBIC11017]|uniref:Uncharacterized protein n=1 Tax=Acaryochloris marina (strain MBIC 11017) TaxID=329726 RepID=B0C9Y2_ACAM1|nr:hypothetical protein AM1_0363 [Acaryochloris marina MBIC11017]